MEGFDCFALFFLIRKNVLCARNWCVANLSNNIKVKKGNEFMGINLMFDDLFSEVFSRWN